MTTKSLSLLAWLGLAVAVAASAQPFTVLKQPTSGDGATGDYFGVRMHADSEWLFVGAYADVLVSSQTVLGVDNGAVKVYRVVGGKLGATQLLLPPEPTETSLFGEEMFRDGQWLAVSAPRNSNSRGAEAGAVFLYRLVGSEWLFQSTIEPPAQAPGGRFGESLWMGGGQLWIGAPGFERGEVIVYQIGSGSATLVQRIPAPAGELRFGQSLVAVGNDQIAIGAPGSAGLLLATRSLPSQTVSRLAGPASFGSTLASSVDALVVGAPEDGTGSVHRWVRVAGQWIAQPVLRPLAGAPGDGFGDALALVGAQLYIGAPGSDRGADFDVGAVYRAALEGGEPTLTTRTQPSDTEPFAAFGAALAANAGLNTVWVGAPLQRAAKQRAGVVFDYRLDQLGDAGVPALRRLDRGDGAQLFRFGQALAIDGDLALVGAFLADTETGADAGLVHAYRRARSGAWEYEAELLPTDAAIEQRFGNAIALSGQTAVIGAYWTTVDGRAEQGAAYVFERVAGVWRQSARLVDAAGAERGLFGAAVAIDDDTLAVTTGSGAGKVHVYTRAAGGWELLDVLNSPVAQPGSFFGSGIGLEGGLLAIGAPGVDVGADIDIGKVFVYARNGNRWPLAQEIESPVAQLGALFGYDVDVKSTQVLAGMPGLDRSVDEPFIGGLWLYGACTPVCSAGRQLVVPDLQAGDFYGISVALNGRHAIGAATGVDSNSGVSAGAAFIHDLTDGVFAQRLEAPPGSQLALFGRAMDLDDSGQLLLGSPNRAGDNPAEGGAHLLKVDTSLLRNGFED